MDMVGEQAGSYRIVGKIGEGGMGVVYRAEHPLIGKKVAVKMLLPEFSSNKDILQRFFNEARATTQLNHPGIIEVFDFGHHSNGSAYIVMELLEGESLAARLRREKRFSINLILELARQIASAVGAAHDHGIIHRDLKPDNVFLLPAPDMASGLRVKVLDFGIAKLTGDAGPGAANKTRTGVLLGTPVYMSPEQCHGAALVDSRTDVYALGCMLFEMAAGHPPFEGGGPGDTMAAQIYQPIPPLPADIDPELAALIRRALAKKPEERFQSMAELGTAVQQIVNQRNPSGPYGLPSQLVATVVTPATRSTLGEAKGELQATEGSGGRRRWIWGAVAMLVTVGVATPAGVLLGRRHTSTPVATAPPPPVPRLLHREILSTPPGAEVYRSADGVRVGHTPWSMTVAPVAGEAVYLVKLAGHREERVTLDAAADGRVEVTLRREVGPVAPPPPVVAPPPVVSTPAARAKPSRPPPSTATKERPSTRSSPKAKPKAKPMDVLDPYGGP